MINDDATFKANSIGFSIMIVYVSLYVYFASPQEKSACLVKLLGAVAFIGLAIAYSKVNVSSLVLSFLLKKECLWPSRTFETELKFIGWFNGCLEQANNIIEHLKVALNSRKFSKKKGNGCRETADRQTTYRHVSKKQITDRQTKDRNVTNRKQTTEKSYLQQTYVYQADAHQTDN
jgi:hypothetical protein